MYERRFWYLNCVFKLCKYDFPVPDSQIAFRLHTTYKAIAISTSYTVEFY